MSPDREKIIKNIFSKDRNKRREAVKKFKEFDKIDETLINYLILMLEDNDSGVVDAAYNALVDIDSELVIKKLVNLISTRNIKLRSYAFEILNQKGKKATNDLLTKLKSENADTRKFALDVLGEVGTSEYETDIAVLLKDEDPNVRYAAAEALGKIGTSKSAYKLLEQLKKEKEIWVKYVIIDSLSKIGNEKIAEQLIKLPLSGDSYTFESIIETISKIADKSVIQQMLNILPMVSEYEKLKIIDAIFNLIKKYGENILLKIKIDSDIVDILKTLLKKEIENKHYVIILLSYFVNSEDYFLFLPFLESDNEDEKVAAILALKRVQNPDSVKYLLKIFEYNNTYVKLNIIETLNKFEDSSIYEKFISCINDETETVKISICKLLTKYYNYEVKKLFKNLLKEHRNDPEFIKNLKKIILETDKSFFGNNKRRK